MNEEQPTQESFQQQPINQPEVTPPVMPPVPPKKSKKKLVTIILIILALVAASVAAWYVLKKDPVQPAAKQTTETIKTEEPTLSDYKSTDLNVSLKYPVDWGEAKLTKGEVYSPGKGDYQQLTFSKRTDVDVNFVLNGFSSPLDGCPDALTTAKHDLSRMRAWTIGWSGEDLKFYLYDSYADTPANTVITASSSKNNTSAGWTKVSTDGEVLIYKDIDQAPYEAVEEGDNSCVSTSQAEAEEANKYYNFTRFALNFKNAKVIGVNAQYDTNKGQDAEVLKQLTEILKSIK